ncbi:Hint module [Planctomycetes bacterium MalM25]|nr:Hint module [Planctomycetes bacterium MalM25]
MIQPGGGCFTGDTPVSTPEGLRSISALRAGDTVLAYDHDSGGWSPRAVTAVHENLYEDSLVTVTTDSGAFRATVHHPVWVVAGRELAERPVCTELSPGENEGGSLAGRWVNSHDLRPGDVLIDRHGDQRTVLRTEQAFVSAEPVFNLTVEGLHTYAVGEIGLLVHNACAKPQAAGVGKVDGVDASEVTPQQRGRLKEGEVLDDLGIPKNNGKVSTPEGNSIPDGLNDDLSVEVKDAKRVAKTKQIRIQTDAAKEAGRKSVLVTGKDTRVSGPAREAFDEIIERPDLGPQ